MFIEELELDEASFFNIHGFEKNMLLKWNQDGTAFHPASVIINHSTVDGGWTWRNNQNCFQHFLMRNEEKGLVSYVVKLGLNSSCYLVIGFKPFTGVF